MNGHTLIIEVAKDGKVRSYVEGVEGAECEDILSIFDNMPGVEITDEGHTDAYYDDGDVPPIQQRRTVKQ